MVDKLIKTTSPNWGGARAGAGRKRSGRKGVCWQLNEEEKVYLRKCLLEFRANKAKEAKDAKD